MFQAILDVQYFCQVVCASLGRVRITAGLVYQGKTDTPFKGHLWTTWLICPLNWCSAFPGMELDFIEFPLLQPTTCWLLPLCIPHISAARTSYRQVVLFIVMGLVTWRTACSLNPKCSNCHVETNSLSIFSTFNPQLLVIFSFFCIGSHGN